MARSPTSFDLRPDWLALRAEPAVDPLQPVIDSHHHLYVRPGLRYLLDDCLSDLASGHNIRATVAVQARAMLRADGPPERASLGETEFLNGQAAMSASGIYGPARVAAALVAHLDLSLGDRLSPLLDAHIAAAGGIAGRGGRLGGIRQPLAWDADPTLYNPAYPTTETLVDDPAFRQGLALLQSRQVPFEIWAYYHQLPRLGRMARDFPELPIVVNHLGGVLRNNAHAALDVFQIWQQGITDLASCPNVVIKLSGLGMRLSSFGFDEASSSPRSEDLATVWKPWVMTVLDHFGPSRCMWGSNFPVDKGSYSYGIGLNAFKLLAAGGSADERHDIFWRTAARHYGLSDLMV
jgi:predicted TIM-barrel fold metal-dependent hydrolase